MAHALSATEVEYFNITTVVKGGPHTHYYLVTKKYISGADFLSRTTLPNPKLEEMHDYAQLDEEFMGPLSRLNATVVTDNVIDLDGLHTGLEICLDHRVGEQCGDFGYNAPTRYYKRRSNTRAGNVLF